MSSIQPIQVPMHYKAWGNRRLFDLLASLSAGEVRAKRATDFGGMVNTLNHADVVDLIWKVHDESVPFKYVDGGAAS